MNNLDRHDVGLLTRRNKIRDKASKEWTQKISMIKQLLVGVHNILNSSELPYCSSHTVLQLAKSLKMTKTDKINMQNISDLKAR
jgi:anti-anti-sigma regulatory factor